MEAGTVRSLPGEMFGQGVGSRELGDKRREVDGARAVRPDCSSQEVRSDDAASRMHNSCIFFIRFEGREQEKKMTIRRPEEGMSGTRSRM